MIAIKKRFENWIKNQEFKILIFFLRRYSSYDMDQWDLLKFKSLDKKHPGMVYVSISRSSNEVPESSFRDI